MLLLLAGTRAARDIAEGLAAANIPAVASLAGVTREPAKLAIPCRIGGFGGAKQFEDYLIDTGITGIIDATHAFADRISRRSAGIADQRAIPYVQLLRPPWQPEPGDNWVDLAVETDAADHIPIGATVFLATGRQTLQHFSNLTGRQLICRQIDPPDGPFPFANGRFLIGRPPFSVAEEVALFSRLNVDWLVVKNAGGNASRSKLIAARRLQIPVAMIRRPPPIIAPKVQTVAQALDWARKLQ